MEGYNGYKNYETWVCNLWFMNDESSYTYWKEAAATAIKNSKDKKAAAAVLMDQMKGTVENDLADFLKIQKNGGVSCAGMFSDLLTNAAGNIDFFEVASSFVEEAEE